MCQCQLLLARISFQLRVQWRGVGSLKWATVGIFTLQNSADATIQGLPVFLESRLLNTYQHTLYYPGVSENSWGDCVTSGGEREKCNENISSNPSSSSVLNLYISCFLLLGYFRVWGDLVRTVVIFRSLEGDAVEEWRCLGQDKRMIISSGGPLVSAELNSPFQSCSVNGTHSPGRRVGGHPPGKPWGRVLSSVCTDKEKDRFQQEENLTHRLVRSPRFPGEENGPLRAWREFFEVTGLARGENPGQTVWCDGQRSTFLLVDIGQVTQPLRVFAAIKWGCCKD